MLANLTTPPADEAGQTHAGTDAELLAQFVGSSDESAFAALVHRHGPMVLGVCRRVLGNHHDAEDAFQATFLLLARKAPSVKHPERIASWLHGVAHRTARKLRDQRQRREKAESQADAPPPTPQPLELAWREVQQALDQEISQLDSKYRIPLVLCYLEGKSHEEAARVLGRPLGSMSWLLGRALSALRQRLSGRGLSLTGGMSSLLLALQAPIPVPEHLVANTLRALGVVGTASPLLPLVDAVLRELAAERGSVLPRSVAGTLLVCLALAGIGYASLIHCREVAGQGSIPPPEQTLVKVRPLANIPAGKAIAVKACAGKCRTKPKS